jgi:hypothetical protein
MPESYPRKYWWTVLIAVPIVVAIAGIVPDLIPGDGGSPSSSTFDLQDAKFQDEVTMIGTQVIMEQIEEGPEKKELESLVQRAINLSRTGFRDEAIELFSDLAQRTGIPELFNNLGALYAADGRPEAALDAYREGLARQPDSESLTINLARLYARQNRVADALTLLDNAPSTNSAEALRTQITESVESGSSEVEPNEDANSPTSISVGQVVSGTLASESDVDFYAFTVAELPRDWTRVQVRSYSPSLKLRVRVFNPDKSQLWQNSPFSSDVTAGQDVSHDLVLQPGQQYFVAVSSLESAGNYDLEVQKLELFDIFEPNDVPVGAASVEVGDTIEANIMDEGDVDDYRVENAGTLTFLLENSSSTLKPQVVVYDGDHRKLWGSPPFSSDVTAGQNIRGSVTAERPGGFYVRVTSLDGKGNYTLNLSSN